MAVSFKTFHERNIKINAEYILNENVRRIIRSNANNSGKTLNRASASYKLQAEVPKN